MLPFNLRGITGVAVIAIAGCNGASAPQAPLAVLPAHQRSETTYPTRTSLVFESDQDTHAVNVYQTKDLGHNPPPIASIPMLHGCPVGLALSNGGTLYVADHCNNEVDLFPKGSTGMSSSITKGIIDPLGIAMDHKDTLFVSSNYSSSITEYARGKISPSKTIAGGGLNEPFGLALDSHENLYVADYGAEAIFEVKAGTSTVTNLDLQGVGQPLGLAIDERDDILYETGGNADIINVYDLRSKAKTPFKIIRGEGSPYAIAIQNRGNPLREVVASDVEANAVYAYSPNTYRPSATLTNGVRLPTGLLIARP